ncbi:hypothetical protein [Microbispora sp. CA-102843]|uniref:hypothetical protein n=1 Tax=Microbispora sp. CA-102843 TaxID=3239952 RepID=UPI003D8DD2C8
MTDDLKTSIERLTAYAETHKNAQADRVTDKGGVQYGAPAPDRISGHANGTELLFSDLLKVLEAARTVRTAPELVEVSPYEVIDRMTPHEACEEAAFALRYAAPKPTGIGSDDKGLADLLQHIGRTMHDEGAPFIEQAAVVARHVLRDFTQAFAQAQGGPLLDGLLAEVRAERTRQDARWGEQNHPDGTGRVGDQQNADVARMVTDTQARHGDLTWRHILSEEVAEAFAEADPAKLRVELLQVAAVALGWAEAIDRRAARGDQ